MYEVPFHEGVVSKVVFANAEVAIVTSRTLPKVDRFTAVWLRDRDNIGRLPK